MLKKSLSNRFALTFHKIEMIDYSRLLLHHTWRNTRIWPEILIRNELYFHHLFHRHHHSLSSPFTVITIHCHHHLPSSPFTVITIYRHHHSPSSSLSPSPPSTVIIIFIISTFSTALAAFSQSTMRHVRLKSIAFSASRHRLMIITMRRLSLINDCNLLSLCVKVHGEWSNCTESILRSSSGVQIIFDKSKTSDNDYLAHLYNSK